MYMNEIRQSKMNVMKFHEVRFYTACPNHHRCFNQFSHVHFIEQGGAKNHSLIITASSDIGNVSIVVVASNIFQPFFETTNKIASKIFGKIR